MNQGNWSPWQPTEADLILARTVRADCDRAEFAFHALAGAEALVAAMENNDILTARRVVRTMRAYVAVDAEPAVEAAPAAQSTGEILARLGAEVAAIGARFDQSRADAA